MSVVTAYRYCCSHRRASK